MLDKSDVTFVGKLKRLKLRQISELKFVLDTDFFNVWNDVNKLNLR